MERFLDPYSRYARLYPSLLTLFPVILTVLAWFPLTLTANWAVALVTVIAACGLLYGLSAISRSLGKRHEKRLLQKWGGWPTTIWLRRRTGRLQPQTLSRYHAFLEKESGVILPTEEDEKCNPQESDLSYESAIKWLQEQARGRSFPLVEKENAEYGFRRNMRGLRLYGIGVSLLAILISIIIILVGVFESVLPNIDLPSATTAVCGTLVFNVITLFAWIFVVTDEWVLEAGDQYARALLAVCDAPSR